MQLSFDDIISGKNQTPQVQSSTPKLTSTQARTRQQSCMISQIDKDLLPSSNPQKVQQNFRMSLSDILSIDRHDQSLENYKKQLLGKIDQDGLKEDQSAEVQIVKVLIQSQEPNFKPIVLDFSKVSAKQSHKFTIKQGSIYRLRIFFKVKYDIVYGLKFVNNVYKLMAKVQKDQQKMGSFAPQQTQHNFSLQWQQAPTGFIARGDYKGKGLFLDNDGIVHCQFNYVMTIDKHW